MARQFTLSPACFISGSTRSQKIGQLLRVVDEGQRDARHSPASAMATMSAAIFSGVPTSG